MGSTAALLPVIIIIGSKDFEVALPTKGNLGSIRMTSGQPPRLLVLPLSGMHVSSKFKILFNWFG